MYDLHRIARGSFVETVDHRTEIDSTNDAALAWAADPSLQTPALLLAERQTAGRGRGANRWWSGDGGMTFSLILEARSIDVPFDRWPLISLAVAAALCAGLREVASDVSFGVKWPNDIHADSRKVAGILIEISNRTPRRIVVGVGINLNNSWSDAPPELAEIGVSLAELTGRIYDPTDVLLELLREIERNVARLAANDPRLADEWQSRCFLRGKHIEIQQGDRMISGACLGIDAEGAVVLETSQGSKRLWSGVVRSVI